MIDTIEFKNGITAGIVLAAAFMLRFGNESYARELIDGAGISPNEDLSFCADYDLRVLREIWPEFSNTYGLDREP